jgi:predicted transporter
MPVADLKSPRMENILSLLGEYWPQLLGLFFIAVMIFNARSWFKERQAQG